MGWDRGWQLSSGRDRFRYSSALARQKWKISIKLALLGERTLEPSFWWGECWGTQRQWEQGQEDDATFGWAQTDPGTGGG